MRKLSFTSLLTMLFVFFCSFDIYAAELQNGTFQAWTSGSPDNWTSRVWAGAESNTWSADQTNYQWSGNVALKITHANTDSYTVAYQTITVEPHSYYTISGNAKVSDIVLQSNYSGGARLYLDNGGGYVEINNTEWKKASISFYSGDRTSYKLYCYLSKASGSVWFDDVTITKTGLNNPGFELKNANNTPQDWGAFILYSNETATYTSDSDIAWNGAYSLRIKHALADTYTAVFQTYAVKPYSWYKVSCMAKTNCQKKNQYSGGAKLFVASTGYSQAAIIPDSQSIWQEASVKVYSGANTSITVYLYLHKASGSVWFDNIKVESTSYRNPYFEIDDNTGKPLNWFGKNWGTTGTALLDSGEKYEGAYSVKINNNDDAQYTYITQKLELERDTYYKLSCWGKVQGTSNNSASIYFPNFNRLYFNSTAWTLAEEHIFSDDNEILEVFPMLHLSTGTFWIDEMSIEKEAHPASLKLNNITLPAYVDNANQRNLKVDGSNFFPIGFFHTRTITQLEEIATAGFNMALISSEDVSNNYLDRANQLGVKVIIIIWNAHILSEIDATVSAYKNHSAVIGWYYYDEPVYQRKTPAEMFEKYERIKANDTENFVTSCFFYEKAFQYHQHCVDVAQDDNYLISSSTSNLGRILKDTLKGKYSIMYDNNKTHFKTLQAYNYSGKVMPSYAQFRAQTFLAIIGDAKGIMYWVYDNCNGSNQTIKAAYPTLWNQLSSMNNEIDQIRTIIEEKTVQINKKGDLCYILKENDTGTKQWLIAVNASASPVVLNITMGATGKTISSIIPAAGSFSYDNNTDTLTDSLAGYDVRVYEIQASSPVYGGEGGVWF
jgi:hypothetical protein